MFTIFDVSPDTRPGPTLTVEVGKIGYGSGVHIGRGYVLTAGHVTSDATDDNKLSLKLDDGEVLREPVLLWSAPKSDLSLLYSAPLARKAKAATLDCAVIGIGERIEIVGAPLSFGTITHTWGRVSSGVVKLKDYAAPVILTDAVLAPGNSGGPVLDARGNVVGIVVVETTEGHGLVQVKSGYNGFVSSSTVCRLLARGV